MENNFASNRSFNEEHLTAGSTSSVSSIKENLKEFKHCILLHEKGLQMQDSAGQSNGSQDVRSIKSKKKTNVLAAKSLSSIQHAEDFQEVNELRMNFKERHQ